jgi:hypothetical protein
MEPSMHSQAQSQVQPGMNRKTRKIPAPGYQRLTEEFPLPYTVVERVAAMEYRELDQVSAEDLLDALMGCFHRFQTLEDRGLADRYQFATVRIHAECLRRLLGTSSREEKECSASPSTTIPPLRPMGGTR